MSAPASVRAPGEKGRAPLRAGLIGLGAMGRNHARILSALDGVKFVGVVDPAVVPAGAPHGSLHGVPVLAQLDQLLALKPDYVVVACPTAYHEEVGLRLAAHGVSALIEKPLAHSVGAARRLVAAFETRGLVAGVGHVERFNPALQQLRARLEAGELGEVYQVVTRRQGPFPYRIADVGVVKDLATHDIDLTGWITGQRYASLSARTLSKSGRPHEDMVAVVGELADGTMVNHLVNWLSPLKERFTAVTGQRGCFVADTLTADLTFHANGAVATEWEALRAFRGVAEGDMVRYAFPKREPLVVEHERFRDAVRDALRGVVRDEGAGSGIVTAREGLRTVQVSMAVLESARLGRVLPGLLGEGDEELADLDADLEAELEAGLEADLGVGSGVGHPGADQPGMDPGMGPGVVPGAGPGAGAGPGGHPEDGAGTVAAT